MNRNVNELSYICLLFGVTFFGCVSGEDHQPEAPAPLPELRYAAPAPNMVWIEGTWHWDGARYVWLPGRWESRRATP
jgi:hypothetical protein